MQIRQLRECVINFLNKLGQAMIASSKAAEGGGVLSLIISLYKIKKSHTKNHKIYQQTIQIFPQLKYPKLDACKDYNESLNINCTFLICWVMH